MFNLNKKPDTSKPVENPVDEEVEAKPSDVEIQPVVETKKKETKFEKKIDLSKDVIKTAINEGKKIIKEGQTKADAARAIFAQLKNEDKDVIVAAFIEGATLTPKGALTYWYNLKRKSAKEAKKSGAG